MNIETLLARVGLPLLLLAGCDGGTAPPQPTWPKRVTLVTDGAGTDSDGVELAGGTIVPGEGDLSLYQAMVLSIGSPAAESICEKGTFEALDDVPVDVDTCPAALTGTWEARAYLTAATVHPSEESTVIGLGLLVWDVDRAELYRLRIIGDSYDAQGTSTATFDYEPVP